MDLAYSNPKISNFISGQRWNFDALIEDFGPNLSLSLLNQGHVDPDIEVNWVLPPGSNNNKITQAIYSILIHKDNNDFTWRG